MDTNDVRKKLETVAKLLKGSNDDRAISRLNSLVRYATDAWLLIDPLTGAVGKAVQILTSVLNDVLDGVNEADQADIAVIVHKVLDSHQGELEELRALVSKLVPHASVCFDDGSVALRSGHGVSSITDHGIGRFSVHFESPLENPDDFLALSNVSGALTTVSENGVEVVLPDNINSDREDRPIKVVITRIRY